jgi:starch phosphorylase
VKLDGKEKSMKELRRKEQKIAYFSMEIGVMNEIPTYSGGLGVLARALIVGKPDMQLAEAAKLMFEKKVKKLPIVEGNRLVGLVTLTDLARMASLDEKTMELIETRERFLEACMHAWDTTLRKQDQTAVTR